MTALGYQATLMSTPIASAGTPTSDLYPLLSVVGGRADLADGSLEQPLLTRSGPSTNGNGGLEGPPHI